jgi:hypothetical protein
LKEYYEKGRLVWVSPGAVTFDREQTELLLPSLFEMQEGIYPAEPSGGYVEIRRPGIGHHAPFETAAQIAAELDCRLARTGLDRYLVEDYYCRNVSERELARRLQMSDWQVLRRIRSAVAYIASGPCPRWLNCLDCPKYPSCRRKKRVGITYREWKGHRRNIAMRSRPLTNRA